VGQLHYVANNAWQRQPAAYSKGNRYIFKQEEIFGLKSQMGLDTKTDRLTDHQLQCDSDLKLALFIANVSNFGMCHEDMSCPRVL
jgi:hypothetical protein